MTDLESMLLAKIRGAFGVPQSLTTISTASAHGLTYSGLVGAVRRLERLLPPEPAPTPWGMRVVQSALATTPVYRVERWPIAKRRRGYRVVRRQEPGMYRLGDGTLIMHPEVYEKTRRALDGGWA